MRSGGSKVERMDWRQRIALDPAVLTGKPVINGTRISVELVIDLLAQGWTEDDVLNNYPGVTRDDLRACLHYASEMVRDERVFPREPA